MHFATRQSEEKHNEPINRKLMHTRKTEGCRRPPFFHNGHKVDGPAHPDIRKFSFKFAPFSSER